MKSPCFMVEYGIALLIATPRRDDKGPMSLRDSAHSPPNARVTPTSQVDIVGSVRLRDMKGLAEKALA